MDFVPIVAPPVDEAASAWICGQLRTYRARLLRQLLGTALPRFLGSLGPDEAPVGHYLEWLCACWSDDPEQFWRHADHWAPTFFLSRLAQAATPGERHAAARCLANLAGPGAGSTPPGSLQPPDNGQGLPMSVFERSDVLGVAADAGDPSGVPPFAVSVAAAFATIERLWPELSSWVVALTPAVASLGVPATPDLTRSQSYGPGCPIFLSQVRDPFRHAEDLLHEVQHHRFQLWALDHPLPGLLDEGRRFVSPYRADIRPLSGLHLGLHAFVTVNELRLRAMAAGDAGVVRRRALLRMHYSNLFAFATITEHEVCGDEGRRYLAAVAERLADHDRRIGPLVRPEERRDLDAAFDDHCARLVAASPDREPLNVDRRYRRWEDAAAQADELASGGVVA